MTPAHFFAVAIAALSAASAAPAAAQSMDLSWRTVDGGGGVSGAERAGARIELLGAIGQHDAARMSGGRYTLTGGWLGGGEAPPCRADCDGSGALEFFDFLCFQNLFAAADPEADCNGDGSFDFFDFLCFQDEFVLGCS